MNRLFLILAVISVFMVLLTGMSVYLISKTLVSQSKVDAVASVAKGISATLSEQIGLFDRMLNKMAQDPEVVDVVGQDNPQALQLIENKLALHIPDVIKVRIIRPDSVPPKPQANPDLSFADREIVKEAFLRKPASSIQGEGNDRYLAFARSIMQNEQVVGVILVSVKFDFIHSAVAAAQLDKGYIEIKQDKLVLASLGVKGNEEDMDATPIKVTNTNWEIYYDSKSINNLIEATLFFCSIFLPALLVILGFVIGFRKFKESLVQDLSWVIKLVKDIMVEKPLSEYPVKSAEVGRVISTLTQFKRVVNEKGIEI